MRTWWVALFLLLGNTAVAQHGWSFGSQLHHGFLWPHRTTTWGLVERHAPAVEVFAERSVRGDRSWHHRYLMPRYGLGVLYTGMGNAERIGSCVRVIPYLYLPFVRHERSAFGMRVGWGIGYVDKPFDRRYNHRQIAIGSRINTAIQLMPQYRMHRGPWTFLGGIGIDHWSNGSFRLPNLGLNYLSAHLGASYRIGASPIPAQAIDTTTTSTRTEWSVVGAFGVNESVRPLTGQHTVFSLVAQRQWTVTPRSAFAAGMDLFNKGTLRELAPELAERPRTACTQLGVHGGYALLLGRGEVFLQMGAYVFSPAPDEAPVFHRLGGRLRMHKHWMGSIALKSHYAVADHWEFGIGYRWD